MRTDSTSHPRPTPDRVVRLRSTRGFAGIFNLGRGAVRVVVVTANHAEDDAVILEALDRLLDTTPSKRLRIFVVMPAADSSSSSVQTWTRIRSIVDRRVVSFIDTSGRLVTDCRSLLARGAEAGLLLYSPEAVFSTRGPSPPARTLSFQDANAQWSTGVDSLCADVERMLATFDERIPLRFDRSDAPR